MPFPILIIGLVRYKAEVDFDGRELTRSYLDKQDLETMLEEVRNLKNINEMEGKYSFSYKKCTCLLLFMNLHDFMYYTFYHFCSFYVKTWRKHR